MDVKETEPTKELVIDIDQFFRIKIPMDVGTYAFLHSAECQEICANKIKAQMINLILADVKNNRKPTTE